ncbi:MAG: acyl-[acyl-carrier-protein] thioesterase [Rectinema subterraneum]|uniref:acyl-[acyl-carrier-protein] thioesterase n=1 Tax=Rectinema subterraneum TaxID=2653714 RepID=UPI003C7C110A
MIQPMELQYVVRGYDCGYGGPLKPFALANFFQEAAGAHALALGIGMEDMWAKGLTWMLARIDIRIERLPPEGQTVVVRTWPVGTKRLFAQRCIELVDSSGVKCAGAMYEYIVVDIKTRHAMRPERTLPIDLRTDIPWPFPDLEPGIDNAAFAALAQALQSANFEQHEEADIPSADFIAAQGFMPAFSIEARARHIDHNGHVNNAHFINWLCDAVPMPSGAHLSRIKIDFVHEILKGEHVHAWAKANDLATFESSLSSAPDGSLHNPAPQSENTHAQTWLTALSVGKELVARGMLSITTAE